LDNVVAATRFVDRIVEKFPLIATHPLMFPARLDIAPDARSFAFRDYLILYRVAEDWVQIVRVVHGARNLDNLFD